MKPGGGKQKGSEFERDICKKLSRWVSHGEREDLFWRSAMSGGRATVGKKQGKDHAKHAGDISATHPLGHQLTDKFYIECKFYADLRFGSWLLSNEGPVAGFWKVAKDQAASHGLAPMLIVKQNRSEVFLIVPAPHILTPGAAGITHFNPLACIARLHKAKADVYMFDGVMVKEFKPWGLHDTGPFLKPGEFAQIMRPRGKIAPATERALQELGASALKIMRERPITKGLPKGESEQFDMALYYARVDKWVHTRRRRDGILKRIEQRDDDAESTIPNPPRAPAKRSKPVRIKV